MSGMCSRYIITRNIFHHHRRQDFVVTSSFVPYLSSKQIRSNSDSYVYIHRYIYTYIYIVLSQYHLYNLIVIYIYICIYNVVTVLFI